MKCSSESQHSFLLQHVHKGYIRSGPNPEQSNKAHQARARCRGACSRHELSPVSRVKTFGTWYGSHATLCYVLDDGRLAEKAARCREIAQVPALTEVQDLLYELATMSTHKKRLSTFETSRGRKLYAQGFLPPQTAG